MTCDNYFIYYLYYNGLYNIRNSDYDWLLIYIPSGGHPTDADGIVSIAILYVVFIFYFSPFFSMKTFDLIKNYKALTEEQKEKLKTAWYFHKWWHYGAQASYQLALGGAECGYFVPFSWVKNQKKYDRRGAKVHYICYAIIDSEDWEKKFKWFSWGRVVNIKYLKNKDWSDPDENEIKKEALEYEPKHENKKEAEKKDLQKIASEALSII